MRSLFALLVAFFAVLLVGCGGKGGSRPSEARASATVRIYWPVAASRYIPANANVVRITLSPATGAPVSRQATRGTGGYSDLNFDDLPTGDCTVRGEAFASAVVQTPIASGTQTVRLDYGDNPRLAFSLSTTLDRIRVTGLSSPATIVGGGTNATPPSFDLAQASAPLSLEVFDANGAALMLDANQFSATVASGANLVSLTGGGLSYTLVRSAAAFPSSVAVTFHYAADGDADNARDFNLRLNLASSVPGSGTVTISAASLPANIATDRFQLEVKLVEKPAAGGSGAVYPGVLVAGSGGRAFSFTNVQSNGNPFLVRVTLRAKSESGGYATLIDREIDEASAYSNTNSPGHIAFLGTLLGSDNTLALPASAYPTVTLPSQADVAFKQGGSGSIGSIRARVGSATMLLDASLFSYTVDAGLLASGVSPIVVSSGTSSVIDAPITGKQLHVTYQGGHPGSTSPTADIPVTVNPNGGHIGVGVG